MLLEKCHLDRIHANFHPSKLSSLHCLDCLSAVGPELGAKNADWMKSVEVLRLNGNGASCRRVRQFAQFPETKSEQKNLPSGLISLNQKPWTAALKGINMDNYGQMSYVYAKTTCNIWRTLR